LNSEWENIFFFYFYKKWLDHLDHWTTQTDLVAQAAVPVMAAVAAAAVPVMAAVAAAQTIGCKLDVWKGTAMRTKGGLMRQHLRLNRVGAVVSTKASEAAKRNKDFGNFQFAAKPWQDNQF
jgi:hypothetical protein